MIKFEKVENVLIGEDVTGLKVVAHARAITIGSSTETPLTKEDSQVTIKTALEYFKVDGTSTGTFKIEPSLTVTCKASELPNSDIFSEETVAFYCDKIVAKTNPDGVE